MCLIIDGWRTGPTVTVSPWHKKLARAMSVTRCKHVAKIHSIFEGTSEIQQLVIARAISGLRIE
jgi:alkylation response protein AidB-like acyl-CoA dehydrogenase